jgi:para-nitrobenzyl esterase
MQITFPQNVLAFLSARQTLARRLLSWLLPALAGPTIAFAQPAAAAGLQVTTVNGIVQGTLEKSGVRSFKGIPYAAPPVGVLRWKAPQPAASWTDVRVCDHFGPRAMQPPIFSDMVFRSDGMSEDCLYLNVWVPASASSSASGSSATGSAAPGELPVLVYFYGGGFVAGDGSEPRYDGESMATKGVIALTVNYRLGIFGLFAHPELTLESPNHSSGNYGLMDQAAALRWVQNNIAAFGGDPKRVTIAGESAGSISVSALMASPESKELFAGAIGESGSVMGALPPMPLKQAEENGVAFAASVGAASLADLRAMPADKLVEAAGKFGHFNFHFTVDGYFFPRDPRAIYEAGEEAHVPLLVGWNSAEGDWHGVLGSSAPTVANYSAAVHGLYGASADTVLRLYHAADDAAVRAVATALASDRFIGFSTWRWADLQGKTGGHPVYRYFYERPRPATVAGGPASTGASHSSEIEYAMGNLPGNKVYAWTPDDYAVSATLQGYFVNFIKTGDPNGRGLPRWPAANSGSRVAVQHINVKTRTEPETHRDRYEWMDKR